MILVLKQSYQSKTSYKYMIWRIDETRGPEGPEALSWSP